MQFFKNKNCQINSKFNLCILLASLLAMLSSCGETRISNPFDTPRPGESGVLLAGNSATFERRENFETLLFLKANKSAPNRQLVSIGFETREGQRIKFEVPTDSSRSVGPLCNHDNRNIKIFFEKNPDLIPICDSVVVKSLSSAMFLSLNYSDGIATIVTSFSSSRTIIDNFDVVITHLY